MKRRTDFDAIELEKEVNLLYKFVLDIELEQAQVRREIIERERVRKERKKKP